MNFPFAARCAMIFTRALRESDCSATESGRYIMNVKNKLASVALTAVMASGMVFANTTGVLPGTGDQNGLISTIEPSYKLPGVVGAEETPSVGTSPRGVMPATGTENEQRGSASPNSDLLPGTDATQF